MYMYSFSHQVGPKTQSNNHFVDFYCHFPVARIIVPSIHASCITRYSTGTTKTRL